MSIAGSISEPKASAVARIPAWTWLAVWVFVLLLINGEILLSDSDTYWHIEVGKWMLANRAVPSEDIYSFTRTGEPWMSSSWLAQVLMAGTFDLADWAGPIVLSAISIAATFGLLAAILGKRLPPITAVLVTLAALALSVWHLLARPHVLALPFMVAWVYGLMSASERRETPSYWCLPLLTLWANLHGGFVFGLSLVAAFAFDACWNAERSQRPRLAMRWVAFGVCAVAACCVTPYGWGSILASRKILDLGELLRLIYEWMPVDFSRFGSFEASIIVLLAGALYYGVRLSPPRIVLVLGLLHMALSHVRNVEIFALLMPLVLLTPVASQLALKPGQLAPSRFPTSAIAALVALLGVSTWAYAANHAFLPPVVQSPAAAVDVLKARNPRRVLNDLPFGGYLISRGVPVFIDGRAELYGEAFEMAYYRALQLKDVNVFIGMLKDYEIDAVMLTPSTPAASLMDHLDGWQRLYADENAVLHVRKAN